MQMPFTVLVVFKCYRGTKVTIRSILKILHATCPKSCYLPLFRPGFESAVTLHGSQSGPASVAPKSMHTMLIHTSTSVFVRQVNWKSIEACSGLIDELVQNRTLEVLFEAIKLDKRKPKLVQIRELITRLSPIVSCTLIIRPICRWSPCWIDCYYFQVESGYICWQFAFWLFIP